MPQSRKEWERQDFSARGAHWAAIALLVILGLIGLLLLFYQHQVLPAQEEMDLNAAPLSSPMGEVEFEEGLDRKRLYAVAKRRLESYGWVNRDRGIVYIPLQRAMEIQSMRNPKGDQ